MAGVAVEVCEILDCSTRPRSLAWPASRSRVAGARNRLSRAASLHRVSSRTSARLVRASMLEGSTSRTSSHSRSTSTTRRASANDSDLNTQGACQAWPSRQQFPDSPFVRKNKGFQKTLFANSCTVYLLPDWSPTREITGDFECDTLLTLLNTSGNCCPRGRPRRGRAGRRARSGRGSRRSRLRLEKRRRGIMNLRR